ncbi:MAG: tol-pal system-associated acyl-CoA thioesterase [Hydrogenophaga sp.]|uniref:tol-pal system-associated acyl-CoA thioesterase n=1 Tax=Hydrogenophaga sp. TaxID=1904254 RepID=UPI002622482F|nr:tol-pal system-associated acyl-CoA thioesterase [Hydrogenophaga sp.]MDM7942490.1 tol-pal system-associated acyl-CoA thioesterase [Hydrogenophaga sp.]
MSLLHKPGEAGSAGALFTWPVRVYWEDTDAGGIVFYANYLKFFERARTEWLRALGIEQQRLREQVGGLFVVTQTQLHYHRPARLDDLLLVTARVVDAGRASMTIEQTALLNPQHSEAVGATQSGLLCSGTIRIGWVDDRELRPQRMPPAIVAALQLPLRAP